MRLSLALAGMLALLPLAALADARGDLAEAARAFDDAALRRDDDNAKPMAVRKMKRTIRLAFTNSNAAPGLVNPTRLAIKEIASEAAIEVVEIDATDKTADFVVLFDENESASGKRNCFARTSWKNWLITSNELKINPAYGSGIDNCIIHEAMHAFGFNSHPHSADSVLSYVYKRRALTVLDRHLIRTLYDPRILPGMLPGVASRLGCRILGERMAIAAADIDAVCGERKGPTAG